MKLAILISIFDQGLLSAFNFFLSIFLIRHWNTTPELFGIYSLAIAASYVCFAIQNALILSQLSVLRPAAQDAEDEKNILAMLWGLNVVIMALAMLITFGASFAISGGSNLIIDLGVSAFVGSALLREYTRGYYFSELRSLPVLVLDIISVALSAFALVLAWTFMERIELEIVLYSLALGQLVASLATILFAYKSFRIFVTAQIVERYRKIWHDQSRWAFISVLASEFQQRGHVFVVATAFGPSQVALLQAAAVVMRPILLIVQAWGKMARVLLAGYFARGEYRRARRFTHYSLGAFILVFAAFLACLFAAWPLVKAHIFVGSFSNVETIVVYWSIATAIIIINGTLSIEAQSRTKFRELSYGTILGAVASAITLGIAVFLEEFRLSILAIIAGQLVLFVVIHRLRRNDPVGKDSIGGLASAG